MSPAEMMMGRKIRTLVPALPETLDPAWPDSDDIRLRDASYKDRAKNYYDCHPFDRNGRRKSCEDEN
jgi:hypothetical protein